MFGNTSNKKKDMELPTFQATFPHFSNYLNFKEALFILPTAPTTQAHLLLQLLLLLLTMSKDCECERHKIHCRLIWLVVAVILIILFIILIVWLALRPTKPRFILQNTDIIQFNLSSSSTLTSIIQATISSHNPNEHVGIYYDNLNVFISYKSQQITLPSSLSPAYQGHGDVDAWSPFLYGNTVPIAPSLCEAIVQDENAGLLFLFIKIDGRLRWKVGSWISGHYHIYVNCPALLTFVNGKASGYSPSLKFRQVSACTVDV